MMKDLDDVDILSNQSDDGKQKVEKTHSPRLKMSPTTPATAIPSCGKQTRHMSSDYAMSDASSQAHRRTSTLSPSYSSLSSLSAPPTNELSSSLQTQMNHLKVECLSSCLTVSLQHLDLSTIRSAPFLENKTGQNAEHSPCLVDTESTEHSFGVEFNTGGSAIAPGSTTAPSKMPLGKENNVFCASRKVCVSGLNSSRWSKRGMSEQNRKQRQGGSRAKSEDISSSGLLPPEADYCMGVMYYFIEFIGIIRVWVISFFLLINFFKYRNLLVAGCKTAECLNCPTLLFV